MKLCKKFHNRREENLKIKTPNFLTKNRLQKKRKNNPFKSVKREKN